MFKAIFFGQWSGLSDPELEKSLALRLDFMLFCGFDDVQTPDYSTLKRLRKWLITTKQLTELLAVINAQLTNQRLKVKNTTLAVVDATIIQTAGKKLKKAIEVDNAGQVQGTAASTDSAAR